MKNWAEGSENMITNILLTIAVCELFVITCETAAVYEKLQAENNKSEDKE